MNCEPSIHPFKWVSRSKSANLRGESFFFNRPCPVCGTVDSGRVVSEYKDFQFFTDSVDFSKRADVIDVVCTNCVAAFKNPCFTDIGTSVLLAEAGYSYGASEGRESEQIDWLHSSGLLGNCGVFLDIGCYDGRFLSLLPQSIRRIGVDIDEPAIQRGRSRDPSIQLIHSSFESFTLSALPEVVTLFHVLEHLIDPKAVLNRVHQESSISAKLVVEVPIIERGATNDINGFFSVAHLTHFSRRTLDLLLSSAGWVIVDHFEAPDYNGYRVVAVKAQSHTYAGTPCTSDGKFLHANLLSIDKARSNARAKLEVIGRSHRVIVWGAGLHTEILFHSTSLFSCERRSFLLVDSDVTKQGKTWRGIPIVSPELASSSFSIADWLVISSYQGQPAINDEALKLGFLDSKIIRLYETVNVR